MSTPQPGAGPLLPYDNGSRHNSSLSEPGQHKSRAYRKGKYRCSCRRAYSANKPEAGESNNDTSRPARGRSTTPKFDRTNGNGGLIDADQATPAASVSWSATNSSVDGQEGLANHQIERHAPIEVGDLGTHSEDAIQRWLMQHHMPAHPYGFPNSLETSMFVESSTVAPSLASSGFLPPGASCSADLLVFTSGGFDEGGCSEAQCCAFTPLWLTHERRYCRHMHLEGGVEADTGYPATLDMCGNE